MASWLFGSKMCMREASSTSSTVSPAVTSLRESSRATGLWLPAISEASISLPRCSTISTFIRAGMRSGRFGAQLWSYMSSGRMPIITEPLP